MYTAIPLTARSTINLVAGNASAVIVGAPGAGLYIRVMAWQMDINRSAGAAIVDLDLRSTTSIVLVGMARGLNLPGTTGQHMEFPSPGVAIPANESITFLTSSSAATGNAQALIWYFIDTA